MVGAAPRRPPRGRPLLAYEELSRLHSANGWSWLRTWADGGRFRPEYVVGGVVSGRWSSRGGGALQIPRALRAAVRADPGLRLVEADAAQLEPRVLAALSGDHALAPGDDDLYGALAAREFGGDRAKAKRALLSAMYGQTSGGAGALLGRCAAASPRAGLPRGRRAHGRRGRAGALAPRPDLPTCPPRRRATRRGPRQGPVHPQLRGPGHRRGVGPGPAGRAPARPVRATGSPARLVFFQHDEVLLHCPADAAQGAADAVRAAAETARRRLFGDGPVRFPMQPRIVEGYDER